LQVVEVEALKLVVAGALVDTVNLLLKSWTKARLTQ
jgi:hypothetical protein